MSGRAGFADDFHQRVLFNLFNSSLNEDHVLDAPACSQHGQVMKRKATPSDDNGSLLKTRTRRSKVWNDFKLDIKSNGKKKASCDHCNKEFVGESKKGTSHLLNHLRICPEKRRKEGGGNKPFGNGNLTAHVVTGEKSTANLELSSLDLTRFAIKRGGMTFMDDLLRVYRDEERKFCESFTKLSCRFSLAVDEVNCCLFITVYYIDENWEMKRNIWLVGHKRYFEDRELLGLNLDESLWSIVWPNNDDRDRYIDKWGDFLGRVPFGDNFKGFASLQGYIDYVSGDGGVVSDIINSMLGDDIHKKLHKAFRYFRSVLYDNDKHDLLTEVQGNEKVSCFKGKIMSALEYKEAFLELEHIDSAFRSVSLTKNEWEVVTAARDCFEVLNDVTCSLSSNKYRTANSCICLILNMYKKLIRLGSNDSNPHSYMKKIASRMRDNFVEGYWKGNSLVISIAAVLDPRFKMDLVRDWYNIIYPMEVEVHILRLVNKLRCIYHCYANVPDNATSSISITSDVSFGIPEIDSYLRKEFLGFPIENFEILAWWRNSTPRFPTLARMARDFLAVPICEVNSATEDDIMKMDLDRDIDEWYAFKWTKSWLQNSHHEVQSLENSLSYHGQGITKTRQGNASSNCVNYEILNHTVRQNTSNTPHPKQTREHWSKVWNQCNLIPKSYRRNWFCGDCNKNLTAKERHMHYRVCNLLGCFTEEFNLGPFRRSDLTPLVDTKKKFKVKCELDGLDLARMTLKLGHRAFADDLLRVYKEEKQKAAKYLNELSCSISLELGAFDTGYCANEIITVQFIDEVWKLQRKILCLDIHDKFQFIGISPEELNTGRNFCSVVYSDDPETITASVSLIKHLFHNRVFLSSSGNFQGILSLRHYINKFISHQGASTVTQKMENILGCDIFEKIRDCYEYVHKKFPYSDKFGKKKLILNRYDHQSWGIALELRETFLKLEGTDLDFKSINLTNKEWDALIAGYNCLKVFNDVASEHLSGNEYTTANVCLPLICDIYKRLQGLHLIYGNNDYICQFVPDLKEYFVEDYWDENGLALVIASVLDPRFKMDVVEDWLNLRYDDEAEVHIQRFIKELRRCCNCYGDDSELNLYLRAPKYSRYGDFGILTWWRDSTLQFPTLARMARDILAIPVWGDNSAMHDEIKRMLCHVHELDIYKTFICSESWLREFE